MDMDEPLLSFKDVCHYLGIGRTTLYTWMAKRHFPEPFSVGLPDARRKTLRWRAADIRRFLGEKP